MVIFCKPHYDIISYSHKFTADVLTFNVRSNTPKPWISHGLSHCISRWTRNISFTFVCLLKALRAARSAAQSEHFVSLLSTILTQPPCGLSIRLESNSICAQIFLNAFHYLGRTNIHWGDLGLDGWIILGWISRRWDVCVWTGLSWTRIETGDGRLWVR